jgi:uncharacterized membrane protein
MKFTSQVAIDRPRQRVLELMTDTNNISQWQQGVRSIELLSGTRGQVGARSRVVFEMRGVRLEMIETVVQYRPPDLFASTFEARGVKNLVENRFYEDGAGRTRWVMDNTLEFKGMMSVLGVFIHDTVTKQTLASMSRFKMFAERS